MEFENTLEVWAPSGVGQRCLSTGTGKSMESLKIHTRDVESNRVVWSLQVDQIVGSEQDQMVLVGERIRFISVHTALSLF